MTVRGLKPAMKIDKNIQDELTGLNSSLPANDTAGAPFSVPAGYFEGLADAVMAKIRNSSVSEFSDEINGLSPLLAGISKQMPYDTPAGYFENNIEDLSAITSEEESLVLSFVDKEGPYEVPLGYFASFPDKVLEKVSSPRAKVVPLFKRKWMKMAVAAVVAGIITISGINYFSGSSAGGSDPVVAIEKSSMEELTAFIKTREISLSEDQSVATADVKELLEDVSDRELEAFLDQVPVEEEVFDIN